jgi:Zn-dependent peptidase ImmA (M78 family)
MQDLTPTCVTRLVILVNSSPVRARRRFSYAHEYAHALLDRDRQVTVTSTDNAAELIEKRANAFAASF